MQKLQVPSTIAKKYTYVQDIDNGAYGKVCLYKNKEESHFALKIFNENGFFKFQVEKKCLLDLQLKNRDKILRIPQIYYDGNYTCQNDRDEKLTYIVLDYLPHSLDNYYTTKILNNIQDDLPKLITQIVTIIKQLHKFGYLHRDIKPDNFRVKEPIQNEDFQIYLIDFGSANCIQFLVEDSNQFQDNVGTSATSSIFTTDDKVSLEGDDLISALYTILILIECENVSWIEDCKEVQGRPTIDQKQKIINHKSALNEEQFQNQYCQRAICVIKYHENLRNTNLQKYQSGLELPRIILNMLNQLQSKTRVKK
ncbi:ck1 family protein kinase [Stylonychia lemnae]|uniref:Ck1 family protein kinase n=1 Tax=Stylonychia lemnae TaxID=5949 RepID=A0A077ZZI1_STYLE|nr:ck1 family protein kinase [Stylonychia lemnae]|eukprot:CDW74643.1 ck1 family protein kinase [Stylonychia lemnae]